MERSPGDRGVVESDLSPATSQPRKLRSGTVSGKGHWKGLSCLKRKFPEQFLGEGAMVTPPPYPTDGTGSARIPRQPSTLQLYPEMKSGSDAPLQRAAPQLRWIFPQLRFTIPIITSYLL